MRGDLQATVTSQGTPQTRNVEQIGLDRRGAKLAEDIAVVRRS
jgi:hypothetical protein